MARLQVEEGEGGYGQSKPRSATRERGGASAGPASLLLQGRVPGEAVAGWPRGVFQSTFPFY